MTLHVQSSIAGDLCQVNVDTDKAGSVAAALASEGRCFYIEPWPNGRSRIFVNKENFGRAQQLVQGIEFNEYTLENPLFQAALDRYITTVYKLSDGDVSWDAGSQQIVDGEVQMHGIASFAVPVETIKGLMR
jgi:hypothetical protein